MGIEMVGGNPRRDHLDDLHQQFPVDSGLIEGPVEQDVAQPGLAREVADGIGQAGNGPGQAVPLGKVEVDTGRQATGQRLADRRREAGTVGEQGSAGDDAVAEG